MSVKLSALAQLPMGLMVEIDFRLAAGERIFLHKKGGVYRYLMAGKSSDDTSEVVIYEHLWPHAREVWVRSSGEFHEAGRFVPITKD